MMKNDTSGDRVLTQRTVIVSLLLICFASLLIRLYIIPQTPLSGDSSNYFVYAADTALKGKLTDVYYLANSGWSLILSGIFSSMRLDDPISLMQTQRFFSVIISVITIIPLYFLCRKFFDQRYSIIGASIFIFEPHIITNSTLGITEPIFLFFGILSITLFLSKSNLSTYISFLMVGMFSIIRFEGIILFCALSILYFIKYRHKKINFLRYPIVAGIFILTIFPIAYINFEMNERDGFVSEILDIGGYSYNVIIQGNTDKGDPIYGEESNSNIQHFIPTVTKNTALMFGLLTFPVLFIFLLNGILFIIKNKVFLRIDFQRLTIIVTSVAMFLPTLYVYGRGIEDVRFLFMLFPLIILISLYGISKINIKRKNVMLVSIIGIIFLVSFVYLDLKKIDSNYEMEVFHITKFINERTNLINDNSVDLRYRTSSGIIVDWPDLPDTVGDSHLDRKLDLLSAAGYQSLREFIDSGKEKKLEYIAVDGRNDQPEFLKDVYYNEEKYLYLEKIFDSNDLDFNYHVKIFKINFEVQNEK